MNVQFKEILRYGLILALICMGAAGLLATVNLLTKAKIIAQAQKEEQASLREVLPEGKLFAPVKSDDETTYYRGYDEEGRLIGVAFKTKGKGYSSTIETMAGMTEGGTITQIKILNQSETPGLGMRISEPEFIAQFKNTKDLTSVQAITGATISSEAVIDSVKKKAAEIKVLMENEK